MPDIPPAYIIEPKKRKREIRFRLDRYLKENGRPLTQSDFSMEKIYYPYWKIEGLELKARGINLQQQQTRRVVDTLTTQIDYAGLFQVGRAVGACLTDSSEDNSATDREMTVSLVPYHSNQMAGPEVHGIPYSIGMRTEYVKMSPYTEKSLDESYNFVPVTRPWSEVLEILGGARAARGMKYVDPDYLPGRTVLRSRGSVVYFPYFICRTGGRRLIIDGLSGRVVHDDNGFDDESHDWPDPDIEFGNLNVIMHRCPTCGIDLSATQSQVYICHNCQTVVCLDKENSLTDRIFSPGRRTKPNDIMFPFWVFRLDHKTVGRIAKKAVIGPSPDKLVIPAFRIANFKVMQRLVQRFSSAFADFPQEAVEKFDNSFQSVDIGLSEAITLAEICLYCEKAPRDPGLRPDRVKIKPREVSLYYSPFHPESYFYVRAISM
jgi:hypothetical protein